jgi:LmbE family N-acetylglucosaminyl deacetylase
VSSTHPLAGPLAVLSPHLDDAALGCGRLLAAHPGAVVITLFAGRPPAGRALTGWDRASGFASGDDVVGARRREDTAAMAALGARPVWLDLLDAQYGGKEDAGRCADALLEALGPIGPGSVLIPLGLFHSDHVRARQAGLAARERDRLGADWYVYGDGLYRRLWGFERVALRKLRGRGLTLDPVVPPRGPLAVKSAAVACYPSQRRALEACGMPPREHALTEETTWRLS